MCEDVHLLSEQFAELGESDSRLQKVRVVLVLPRCTASALTDPIVHIINEDGGTTTQKGQTPDQCHVIFPPHTHFPCWLRS